MSTEQADDAQRRATTTARGGDGEFTRSTETAEHDAEAARLRSLGWSYRKIAAELQVDVATAHRAVQRALRAIVEEPAQDVRALELERLDAALVRLDDLEVEVRKVLERNHITVSNGRVMSIDDVPLVDDGPVLAALDRLLKIEDARLRNSESRRKLLGADAPAKAEIGGKLTYEILGVDLDAL